jgi:glycerophosphoryl diester phosphodiesterase
MSLPLVVGHRGASADAPENTLAAFDLALAQGADGVEFDVRLARDGVPIVIHDATLRRTARLDARVDSLTSSELGRLDASSWFTRRSPSACPHPSRAGIPTLDETLALVAQRSRVVYVELKSEAEEDYAALAAAVVGVVRRHDLAERAVIKCFQHEALREVKRLAPELRTAALFERAIARPFISANAMVAAAQACGAAEVSLHHSLLRRAIVRAAEARSLRTLVWTIDTAAALRRACHAGASVVFTNRPSFMRAALLKLSTAVPAPPP